ncbi:hypothetical protein B0H14DRAFT_2633623 [Mycena olivaceomarginata]|nr:hypothetical protein B0H14DRAFT_2633623 [Mycena olivaceomarginata]
MAPLPLSPEVVQRLAVLESKLDEIRRSIEKMPAQSKNGAKRLMTHLFDREYQRLKTELKRSSTALLQSTNDTATDGGILHADGILELASLSTRAQFLKPRCGQRWGDMRYDEVVKSNREAALELASIPALLDLSAASDGEALVALNSVLEKVRLYLADLQRPRRRMAFLIMVNHGKDGTMQMDRGLDKTLGVVYRAPFSFFGGSTRTI